MLVLGVLGVMVLLGVGGNVEAEQSFANVGYDTIAKGSDADGADIADYQNGNEPGLFAMGAEKGGSDHSTKNNVGRMKDSEKEVGFRLTGTTEYEHKHDAHDCAKNREGRMVFQFEQYMVQFLLGEH